MPVITVSTNRWHANAPAVAALQISKAELGTAMSFLRGQLGEDELRHLLEQLSSFNDKCASVLLADISIKHSAALLIKLLTETWLYSGSPSFVLQRMCLRLRLCSVQACSRAQMRP